MEVVMALAQRITVLNIGQVLASGRPEEIRANTAVQAAYRGRTCCGLRGSPPDMAR